nr:ferric-chelate reductase 1-like [Parasteatoda tepidariorum]
MLLLIIVSCCALSSLAFPRGAPAESCESLLPRHVGTEAMGPQHSPYSFIASGSHYHYRMNGIHVQLAGPRFKGFLVAAIDPNTHERIGDWVKIKGTKTLPCSAISHGDPYAKKKVILMWKPPKDRPKGEVIFMATVLKSYGEYYSGIVAKIPPNENEDD